MLQTQILYVLLYNWDCVRGPALPPARPDSVFRFPFLALGTPVPTARHSPFHPSCLSSFPSFPSPVSIQLTYTLFLWLDDDSRLSLPRRHSVYIVLVPTGPVAPALEILRLSLLISSLDAPVCPLTRSSSRSSTTRLTRPRTSARGPHIF